uniref:Putative portal protein n=1 Tax=viral metagenome TaxID=1070528 RepID=A0A6M3J435_9ZZZZ
MPFWDTWLDRQVTRLGYTKAQGPGIATIWAGEAPLGNLDSYRQDMDQDQWEKLAITCSWVYACIDVIAKQAAAAKLEVFEMVGEELEAVSAHPFEAVMRQPNRFMGRQFFKRYLFTWWLLRGEAYWWPVRDQTGVSLSQFWPIPSNRIQPVPDREQYIKGYLYKPKTGSDGTLLSADTTCFHRLPNPFDYHRGMSPISAYGTQLKTDKAMREWNLNTFDKGSPLKLLVSVPEQLSTPNFERFVTEIREEFDEGNRVLFGRGNEISAKEFGMSAEDMEFLAGREFTREEIGMIYGIPAGFWAKDSNRANAEAARATMIEMAVWPLLLQFAEDITAQVVQPLYGEQYVVQPEDIRPRDRALQIQEEQHERVLLSFNQARQKAGEDEYSGPLSDLISELPFPLATDPQFIIALMNFNRPQTEPPAAMPEVEPPEVPEIEDESVDAEAPEKAAVADVVQKAMREDLRRWESIARRRIRDGQRPADYEFVSQYIPKGLKARVQSLLGEVESEDDVHALFRFTKAVDLSDVETRIRARVEGILSGWIAKFIAAIQGGVPVDYAAFQGDLQAALMPEMMTVVTEQWLRTAMEIGVEFDSAEVGSLAAAWAREYTFDLVKGLTETTQKVVQQATSAFMDTPGMTREDLEALLMPAFGEYRASMIAVTETTRAYAMSQNLYQKLIKDKAGIDMMRIWRTNRDEKTCPICSPLDGQPERVWGGDFSEGPPAHVNCRCSLTLTIGD